ncbi:IS200/IS605 family transposase [Clostridioides difficile]|uniref:IS200/IS605 family transposase n=1 Tax=Clostridioides difficile TaxID=1496 RepID=UPI000F61130C|nr:IS200/IS605 family transposase [Clostridioides difficile]EGT3815326.1 IS200/IS605 family transposase [Clostridioides difficile]EGT4206483.1 IS200/IS605 family transposase [Clostridioides difficile]ELX4570478.1 IS200/IS605 family transposase [Clostridioides difficile]MBY1421671.1 IS200/IS605 family transposase [Clostridioides difficile]MBY1824130.1 IS200/IS605 family transposase [Clostridioides difficile]
MDYVSRNHSKYLLLVHLIFVCKYRKNLLIKFGDEIKHILSDVAKEKDLIMVEMEVDKNHVHLLVKYKPTVSILEIVRWFKQISTYRIWRINNNQLYLNKYFWKEKTFWSDGYFACSIGAVSKETIERYIHNQG